MSTRTKLITKRSSKYLEEALYRRLFREGSSPEKVKKELTTFLKSRKRVFKWEVGDTIKKLRDRKRFHPALKLSETMARRGMNLTNSDHAIRLDLVCKGRGIASAEEYFVNLPESSKTHHAYGALLNCYCKELMTEKAEALMEKMKELEFAFTPMSYNSLMTLYSKTNQPDKIPSIIQEMKTNDVPRDCFTYNIWMRSLAAMNDISGVDRVMEEMKRDGRVAPDWTTYSNLASIYANAGMFEKAEEALKELEEKNNRESLEAYQFLITLYGHTGNLIEVHRVWRSLKLQFPKMANISYLNMIQEEVEITNERGVYVLAKVLVKLNDLPGAEACFKEWESSPTRTTYDIRIFNALFAGYLQKDMFETAELFKKRSKRKGARLNAKTWEILTDYYFKKNDMNSVFRCVDRGIKKGKSHDRIWIPKEEVVTSLMSYFESKKDVKGAESFVELLKTVKKDLGMDIFEHLLRTYVAAGKKSPGMRHRLKMENVVLCEASEKLLEEICPRVTS